MSSKHTLALTLAAIALVPVGCGESSSSSSKPLERGQLLAKGNAICRRITTRLAASTVSGAPSDALVMLPVAAYEHSAAAQMRKLTPPASMAQGWKQMIAGLETLATATANLGEDARTSNHKAEPAHSSEAVKGTKQMTVTAQREGFRDCAEIP